jgi:anthranilate synthase component 2
MCDQVVVKRNDEMNLQEIADFDKIVLSPGPGLPKDAGNMPELLNMYIGKKPILGVCLGMQAIAEHFGGELYNQKVVRHGITTEIKSFPENTLFQNLPSRITVGLYHSWAVRHLPEEIKVTAMSSENVIMAIEHKTLPIYGVQFHPESILTEYGREVLMNFVM